MAQGRTRLSAGDYTGREKGKISREQAEEQARAAAVMSMASAVDAQDEEHGIHDPQSQATIDHFGDRAVEIIDVDDDEEESGPVIVERRPPPSFGGLPQMSEPVLTGQEPPEVVEKILAEYQRPKPRPGVEVLQSATVIIRTDEDVEDMTYGMRNGEPNNYTFKAGVAYKVPREIAEHLRERDLVRSFH
jgi:hypothetical protein